MNERVAERSGKYGSARDRQQWELLHTNQAAWEAAVELCANARESIAIEQFIFSDHGIGDRLLEVLTEKASAGVRVQVLADGFGSRGMFHSQAARNLAQAGGEIRSFHGVADFLHRPLSVFRRLHRKTLMRDGKELMVGGSCFSPRMRGWRDTMLRLNAPDVAQSARAAFDALWRSTEVPGAPVSEEAGRTVELSQEGWSYAVSLPFLAGPESYSNVFLGRIAGAKRSVRVTTPYLLPDRRMRQALAAAASHGAEVQVLVPVRSDHMTTDLLGRFFAWLLKRRGVHMHGYEPGMLHAKIALIDDALAVVGSFNYGIDSMWMNIESVALSQDPAVVAEVAAQLDRDFGHSRRL